MTLPLAGIKVAEIAANLAGPFAAEILGHKKGARDATP